VSQRISIRLAIPYAPPSRLPAKNARNCRSHALACAGESNFTPVAALPVMYCANSLPSTSNSSKASISRINPWATSGFLRVSTRFRRFATSVSDICEIGQSSFQDLSCCGRWFPTFKRWAILECPSGTKTWIGFSGLL